MNKKCNVTIYTSYFARYRGNDGVSIAAKAPDGFMGSTYEELVPPKRLIYQYKSGAISQEDYIEEYEEILSDLDPHRVAQDLDGKVLLCWEKVENFCHRKIVASWLESNGYECIELGQKQQPASRKAEITLQPTRPRMGDTCHWCKFGIRENTRIRCNNRRSTRYGKLTRSPTRTTCDEWRYKF